MKRHTIIRRDTDHALRMLVYIASRSPTVLAAPAITDALAIPPSFANKVLRKLTAAGILRSRPGNRGGFTLARPTERVSLLEVLAAVQSPPLLNLCTGSQPGCPRQEECRIGRRLDLLQEQLNTFLSGVRLSDVLEDGTVAVEKHTRPMRSMPAMADRRTQVEACRGCGGGCRNALIDTAGLARQIEAVLDALPADTLHALLPEAARNPHRRLRVALAACPNACTQPQIRDIGLIASVRPKAVRSNCTGCGRCAAVCREGAIRIDKRRARLLAAKCIGCGQCGKVCGVGAIEMDEPQLRILVGGRMGRHPRFAMELPLAVHPSEAAQAVAGLLELMVRHAGAGASFSTIAEKVGTSRLGKALRQRAGGRRV